MKKPVYPIKMVPEIQVAMEKENQDYSCHFVQIAVDRFIGTTRSTLISAWRNRYFLVQVYFYSENVQRMSVNRTCLMDDGLWQDHITWDELQNIKNKIGYAQYDALEVYPREEDIVDVANVRHLWVLKKHTMDFIWRKEPSEGGEIWKS